MARTYFNRLLTTVVFLFAAFSSFAQIPSFNIPDTVCVNSPVNITNTSTGATSYYWNFCTADLSNTPAGVNLGNLNGQFSAPVFADIVSDNGKYYAFVTNYNSATLVRLDFGTNMLNNNPTITNLGGFNGALPPGSTEGIQVVKNEGKWYAIIVGGGAEAGTTPAVVKISFGTNIENNSPTAVNYGNLDGALNFPHDLHMFQDKGRWYGFTVNKGGNTITRFDFTTSFENTPTATNIIAPANSNLNLATGLFATNDENNNWHLFVVNSYDEGFSPPDDGTITRFDFGSSLLNNTPTAVNITNSQLGSTLHNPRDIYIIKFCGQVYGFVVNHASNDIVRLDFNNNISSIPSATSLGNIGGLNFPHSISKLFRVGSDVYSFIPNAAGNTLTRIKFPGCTNASIPNYAQPGNPPAVTYNTPGTYNINLTIDEGLSTQAALCKQVVVVGGPKLTITGETAICSGDSAHLRVTGGVSYTWSTSTGTIAKPNSDAIAVKPSATTKYYVTGKNTTGCSTKDSVTVQLSPCKIVNASFTTPDTVCVNSPVKITNTSVGASSYYWNFCTANLNTSPIGVNIGNFGSLNGPVFSDFAEDNGNYYLFITNNYNGNLCRLDFGNSLLNPAPNLTNLGNFNGLIEANTEGVQVVKNNGKWYVFIVGGDPQFGTSPQLVKVELGTNVANNNPTAQNWGDVGGMDQPTDLYMFEDNGSWYGYVLNAENNTLTRITFGSDFSVKPVGTNLGNVGGLFNYPTGLFATKDNNKWYVFVVSELSNTIARLDFGGSLQNMPTGVNIVGQTSALNHPRDITLMKSCDGVIGFSVNIRAHELVKLDFGGSLTNMPTTQSLGNVGGLAWPHSLSKLFRSGADIYGFITNVQDNSITRLQFPGCKDASIPSSTAQNPPDIKYSKPGVYNINLTIDDSLATQTSFCKQVVVVGPPDIKLTGDSSICTGDSAHLTASGGTSYSWLPTTGVSDPNSAKVAIKPLTTTKYYITVKNSAGCTSKDSVMVKLNTCTVCDNWASASGSRPRIRLGDLDVAGHTITVEASFNRTTSFNGGDLYAGDLVSKHADPSTVNYLLRPNDAEITTSNGYFIVKSPCGIELNKTYHVAFTYDGTTLKFYRDGYLMAQQPASGDLYLNDLITTIGTTAYDLNPYNTDFQGFINEVRIWNVVRTPAQIKQYMNASLPNPVTQTGLLAYYVFNSLKNKQGNAAWDAYIQNNAAINATNTSCSFTADSCGVIKCTASPDFSFMQDVCNPNTIQFRNETVDVETVSWDFGNNQSTGNNLTPSVTYNAYGTYPVTLTVTTTAGCVGSITKQMSVNVIKDDIITTKDTVLCKQGKLQLNAVNALSYCWSPAGGLSATDIVNPVADISKNATYYLTSKVQGKNLIVNGDFSQGNTGFTSEYSFSSKNTTEGQYYVGPNPSAWNASTAACSDHTGNKGNMLLINGNPQPDLKVWTETINVQRNTNYAFSAWLQAIYSINPAQLQFYINGKTMGNIFTASLSTCNWQQFYVTLNSGDTDKVTISIINKNTQVQGNDFALDDISFAESIIKTDSVVIKTSVATVKVSADTSICAGSSVQLSAQVPANATYKWSPGGTLSNVNILSPIASPQVTTTYTINVTNIDGCKIQDSVKVTVMSRATVKTIADTAICSGNTITLTTSVINGTTYKWSPAQTLNDATVQSPIATPTANTQYIVTVNGGSTCSARDTVNITVKPSPVLQLSNDTTLCNGTSVQLLVTSPDNPGYTWDNAATLSNASISNPVATPASTTVYHVLAKGGNGCTAQDSVKVTVLPQPTVKTIADTAICNGNAITLTTSVVNGATYKWSPAQTLNDATVQSPIATPTANTQYIVTVNGGSTCFARDTVDIAVKPSPVLQLSNDTSLCNGTSVQLLVTSPDNPGYTWDNAATLSNATISNPVATPASTTVYHVLAKGSNGCTAQDSVKVTVLPQPTVKTIADTAICNGALINLTTNVVNGNTYSWSPVQDLSDATQQSPQAKPSVSTQYIITVNPGTPCIAKDTVNIIVNPLPVVQTSNDTTLCSGASVQLTATAAGNVSYSWAPSININDPSVNNPVVSPNSPTTYTVTVTDDNKCSSQSSVKINVIPQPVFAISPATKEICLGDVVILTASGGDIYQWSPAETVMHPTAATTQVKPLSTTTYTAVITNSTCKIADTLSAIVTVNDKLTTSVSKSNDIDCVQGSATLQASGGLQYAWTPNTNISYSNSASPVVSPLQTTTYYVTVTKHGCKATDSITVYVTPANEENAYKMPSAFTPNGDGLNDCFGLKYWGGVKSLMFEVYNRWGNRIFYTTDPSKCWDGTYKGQLQMGGTYVYQISAVTICGNIYRKGTVVLIR